jgi:hypothetical protein
VDRCSWHCESAHLNRNSFGALKSAKHVVAGKIRKFAVSPAAPHKLGEQSGIAVDAFEPFGSNFNPIEISAKPGIAVIALPYNIHAATSPDCNSGRSSASNEILITGIFSLFEIDEVDGWG